MKIINIIMLAVAVVSFNGISPVEAAPAKKKSTMTSFEDLKFNALDPNNANGPHMAVAWGDPWKGPSAVYLKMKPGASPVHSHSSGYQAVSIQGQTKHWDEGSTEKDAKVLPTGSAWHQPGKANHGDSCVGDQDCVIFIVLDGKFDFIPAPAKK